MASSSRDSKCIPKCDRWDSDTESDAKDEPAGYLSWDSDLDNLVAAQKEEHLAQKEPFMAEREECSAEEEPACRSAPASSSGYAPPVAAQPAPQTKTKKKRLSRSARLTKQKRKAETAQDTGIAQLTNYWAGKTTCDPVETVTKVAKATLAIDHARRARSSAERNKRKRLAKMAEASGAAAKSKSKK